MWSRFKIFIYKLIYKEVVFDASKKHIVWFNNKYKRKQYFKFLSWVMKFVYLIKNWRVIKVDLQKRKQNHLYYFRK